MDFSRKLRQLEPDGKSQILKKGSEKPRVLGLTKHDWPFDGPQPVHPLFRLAVQDRIKEKLEISFWMKGTKIRVNGPGWGRLRRGGKVIRIGGLEAFHVNAGHKICHSGAAGGLERFWVGVKVGFGHRREKVERAFLFDAGDKLVVSVGIHSGTAAVQFGGDGFADGINHYLGLISVL